MTNELHAKHLQLEILKRLPKLVEWVDTYKYDYGNGFEDEWFKKTLRVIKKPIGKLDPLRLL